MNTDRPQPFSKYTAADLWCNPHISANMLACHLHPEIEAASRSHAFIEKSAAWIINYFNLGGKSVGDFGCGPGLYAVPFAKAGANVTGIDFGPAAIAHARQEAELKGLSIEYIEESYLGIELNKKFDLITLIYTDLCVLSPSQRKQLLTTFASHLNEGGKVLLDVATLKAFAKRDSESITGVALPPNFWSPSEYDEKAEFFSYPDEKLMLDKYTITEGDKITEVYNWMQYFDAATITAELEACGLKVEEFYGNVAGDPLTEDSDTFAIVAELA